MTPYEDDWDEDDDGYGETCPDCRKWAEGEQPPRVRAVVKEQTLW